MDGTVASDDLLVRWDRFLTDRGVTATALFDRLPAGPAQGRRTADLLTTYVDEGPVAVGLVAPHLRRPSRILEVGSGIGLVSRFLAEAGHDVVATEPAPDGFDLMRDMTAAVDAACGTVTGPGSLRRLDLGVDDLDPDELGRFDLVFSVNVLEHVPDPARALIHLQRFVTEGGLQTHVCPNYTLPYEPHIMRPLVPFVPAATRRLLPPALRDAPEFLSVNFVTAGRLRRAARSAGLRIEFDRGLIVAALDRFGADPTFAARHARLGRAVRWTRRLGLDRLLARVPPGLASPMRFTVRAGDGPVRP